jgi:hypothetical protein
MATKRYRKNRKSRKNKKGGILGIPALKTQYENISNCKKYWSDKYGKDPKRCDNEAKIESGKSYKNYPGILKLNLGKTPSVISPNGAEANIFNDSDRW